MGNPKMRKTNLWAKLTSTLEGGRGGGGGIINVFDVFFGLKGFSKSGSMPFGEISGCDLPRLLVLPYLS